MEGRREILVVDDDPVIRRSFTDLFESEGYSVTVAKDGAAGVKKFHEVKPDVVLMDVMMPKMNGTKACEAIREADALVPILFFTAAPSDVSLVRGLGFGADDYIPKDRSPEEFLARVQAALRRYDACTGHMAAAARDEATIGNATVDFTRMKIVCRGKSVQMTRSEGIVLKLLASTPGRYYSYEKLFAALCGDKYMGDESSVRMLMSRIKHKLGVKAGNLIVSSRGLGYKLVK